MQVIIQMAILVSEFSDGATGVQNGRVVSSAECISYFGKAVGRQFP